ncbi:hypothetical protein EQ845_22315 [Pseudomonas putida]|uniref:hypothetical protein n=1 Tax=Pseudomonas putida TaxID=303 RepID=UPI00117A59B5|nr:hypothetical protein [Pseudomonas putida]TRO31739.1 hypothetical protein EQ845_22315 [Pseudomonas putida]
MNLESISCWIELHPGLASWVQAFGAIAALLIAIWVASSQRRSQERLERERAKLIESHVRSLAERSKRAVAVENMKSSSMGSTFSLITGLSHSLDSINLLSPPSTRLLEPVSTLRDSMRALEGGMRQSDSDGYLHAWIRQPAAITLISLVVVSADQILNGE